MTTHRMLHLAHLALVFPPHKWSNEPMVPFYCFSLKKQNKKKTKHVETVQIWPLGKQRKKMLYQDDSDLKHETLEKKGINQVILKIEH